MVTIIGIIDNRKKNPRMKPNEQISSPKIAKTRDDRLEILRGSGNEFCNNSKLDHLAKPWLRNNTPKIILNANRSKL